MANFNINTSQFHEVDVKSKSLGCATYVKEGRKICFVGTCYNAFMEHHYRNNEGLQKSDYQTQLKALLSTGFGDSDFYSRGMADAGWMAFDVIANCAHIQMAWAQENGFEGDLISVLVEQMQRLRPDVIYLQDLSMATQDLLERLRPYTKILAGQIASPIPAGVHLEGLNIIISSLPNFVEKFRKMGIISYYQALAFDPKILDRLGPRNAYIDFSFVGGISSAHTKGTSALQEVAELTEIFIWGYGAENLEPEAFLRKRHKGEAWGLDMFQLLHSSRITFNRHIDISERFANNMRLFEATGTGALLITDYKDNLGELFCIGEEIVAYRSAEECADLVDYYLAHPEEAEIIARAGQARTLTDHNYVRRMAHTAEILDRHLRQLAAHGNYCKPEKISYGYQEFKDEDFQLDFSQAWKNPAIPARQRALVELQLVAMYKGKIEPIFQVLSDLLDSLTPPEGRLLEVGCSSGYYYEILEYLLSRRIRYVGVDYSDAFIQMARSIYPAAQFECADGACLPFPDRFFPVVISSCVLLHVSNFRDHIQETARVARDYIVVHRTPVCRSRKTQMMKKFAYEVETIEFRFNESELIEFFMNEGFALDRSVCYYSDPTRDEFDVSYLFRNSKKTALDSAA